MPLLSKKPSRFIMGSLESEVSERVQAGNSQGWIFIVPNRIAQRRLERELLDAVPRRAVPTLEILTLADLAGTLAAAAFPELHRISDAESAVLIELSLRELMERGALAFFEPAFERQMNDAAFPISRGTFELIVNTIRQLKESGVAPMALREDVEQRLESHGESTEVRRARDILCIYEAYHRRLEARFMDTYGQVLLVNERYDQKSEALDGDFRVVFPHVSEIFVAGFFYLEPPSIALLSRLADVPGIQLTIELEERRDNPELFEGLIELEKRLKNADFRIQPARAVSSDEWKNIAADRLFHVAPKESPKAQDARLQYFTAHNAVEEIEEIARAIKLIADKDPSVRDDLSRITIATPSVETYTPIVQEVFRRHEIAVEIADRYRLDRSPLVLAILALLELARGRIRTRELIRVFGSPYFSFEFDGFDGRNLVEMLAKYRPGGDRMAVLRSLEAQAARIDKRKEESEDGVEWERYEREKKRLGDAARDLNRLSVLCTPFEREMTPQEFSVQLTELLARLNVRTRLLAASEVTLRSKTLDLDTRAYRAFTKLLEDVTGLFHLLEQSEVRRPLLYYQQRLKAALMLTRFARPVNSRAVLVTSISQSISQSADYLFLAGLSEGSFPSRYEPQIFLTESFQKAERKQLFEDRVLFYQAITNFKKGLFLSYPRKSSVGTEINRSAFLDALDEVADIAEHAQSEGVFSYRDLYLHSAELMQDGAYSSASNFHVRILQEYVPQATRALEMRFSKEDSVYRGMLDLAALTEAERAAIESNRTRVWSITQLELYAKCPFHYFAKEVLRLGAMEEAEEGLDARDRGSALHEVLREFLASRREQKLPSLQEPEADLHAAYSEVRAIAGRYFERLSKEHPFWKLDAERLLSEERPGGSILRKFIEKERELSEFYPRPAFFEVSFGGTGKAPVTNHDPVLFQDEPVILEGVRLRGKIDRIDIPSQRPDGSYANDGFVVIDYKSGKSVPSWHDIHRGLSLQLPLYLKVAEELLRAQLPELKGTAAAAFYQKVLDPDSERALGLAVKTYAEEAFASLKSKKNGVLETPEQLTELIEESLRKAKHYVEGISQGYFPLTESDLTDQCRYCSYRSVCRIEEAKDAGVLRAPMERYQ